MNDFKVVRHASYVCTLQCMCAEENDAKSDSHDSLIFCMFAGGEGFL